MKKVNEIFNIISIWMFSMAIIGISVTFLSDYLNDINWFGDFKTFGYKYNFELKKDIKYEYIEWGSRHYWYVWTAFLSVLLSTVRLIVSLKTKY